MVPSCSNCSGPSGCRYDSALITRRRRQNHIVLKSMVFLVPKFLLGKEPLRSSASRFVQRPTSRNCSDIRGCLMGCRPRQFGKLSFQDGRSQAGAWERGIALTRRRVIVPHFPAISVFKRENFRTSARYQRFQQKIQMYLSIVYRKKKSLS